MLLVNSNMDIFFFFFNQKHVFLQRTKAFIYKPQELETICEAWVCAEIQQVVTGIWEPQPDPELSRRVSCRLCHSYMLWCGKGGRREAWGWRSRLHAGWLQGGNRALLTITLGQQAETETVTGKLEPMVTLVLSSKLKTTMLINCPLIILEVEDGGKI